MHTICRRLEFDAAHRVVGHEGKCRHLHGHRYVVDVYLQDHDLDHVGRVLDFGWVKTVVGGWIDANLDHNILLNPCDPMFGQMGYRDVVRMCGRDPYIMTLGVLKDEGEWNPGGYQSVNPTAENIAYDLFYRIRGLLIDHSKATYGHLQKVRVWETPNCFADYEVTKR